MILQRDMIEGVEWLFIIIIILLLIFYEPRKITQLTRAIAQAKKEYEKASSMLMEQISVESEKTEDTKPQESKPIYEHEPESVDLHIIKFARMFNIPTYGKTLDEIRAEINKKAKEYFLGNRDVQLPLITPVQQTSNNESNDQNTDVQTLGDSSKNKEGSSITKSN